MLRLRPSPEGTAPHRRIGDPVPLASTHAAGTSRGMSAFVINVTFDCADPERLAGFWAEVTGYERMEESTEDVVALRAPDSRGLRRILFFRVPEPKAVKNRVHVDLASREPAAEIERFVALGATRVGIS
jgi:hypothetical protein